MSYCRWSSMNFMCDVYVYEDVSGGWTTHVASCRRIVPPVPDIMMGSFALRMHRWSGACLNSESREFEFPYYGRAVIYKLWTKFSTFWHRYIHGGSLRLIPLRPIGLPHDGETFNNPTAAEGADNLEYLRGLGYRVPQYAIDALREEGD